VLCGIWAMSYLLKPIADSLATTISFPDPDAYRYPLIPRTQLDDSRVGHKIELDAEQRPNQTRADMATTCCDITPTHEWHGPYHDAEYGFPLEDDATLFERLVQAGLSWLTILKKREAFRRAYDGFEPEVVARYGARERRRLLKLRPPWSRGPRRRATR
jgi:Methyladenine glycosylase